MGKAPITSRVISRPNSSDSSLRVIGWKYAIPIKSIALALDSSARCGPPSAVMIATPNPSLVRKLRPPATVLSS